MQKEMASGQLNFLFNLTESSLNRYLEEKIGKQVSLAFTQNRSSMLSAKIQDGILRVRLHRIFMNAGNQVIDEIASFLRNRRGRMPGFHRFVRENREHLNTKPPKKIALTTSGKFHDLRELCDEINAEYFGGMINAVITWGSRSPRSSVRKRTLGSYSERSDTIRINPVLDKKSVPRFYVAFIVYHEMLHAAMGITRKGGRRSVHSRDFRKRERLFKDFEKARAWELGSA
jgi:hypothetical protein